MDAEVGDTILYVKNPRARRRRIIAAVVRTVEKDYYVVAGHEHGFASIAKSRVCGVRRKKESR